MSQEFIISGQNLHHLMEMGIGYHGIKIRIYEPNDKRDYVMAEVSSVLEDRNTTTGHHIKIREKNS